MLPASAALASCQCSLHVHTHCHAGIKVACQLICLLKCSKRINGRAHLHFRVSDHFAAAAAAANPVQP